MIECVFSASLETIRREPRESELLRSVAYQRDLAACASIDPDVFVFSFIRKGFYAAAVGTHFPAGTKSCCLRSTANM